MTDMTAMKRVSTDKEDSSVRQSVRTDVETILSEEDVEDHDEDDVAKQVLAEATEEVEQADDDVVKEQVSNDNLLPPSILKKESPTS